MPQNVTVKEQETMAIVPQTVTVAEQETIEAVPHSRPQAPPHDSRTEALSEKNVESLCFVYEEWMKDWAAFLAISI